MAVELSAPGGAPKKPHRKKTASGRALTFAVFLAASASAVFLVMGVMGYKDMRDMVLTWTEIAELASQDDDAQDDYIEAGEGGVKAVSAQASSDLLYKTINLKALQEINPDVSGYIYIPGTSVDYPILKETEPEAYFYIDHNIYKEKDQYGSIFELCDEERGDPENDNPVTWLFGHHMRSGSMFATLYNYEDPEFQDTPVYIYREDWRAEYEVFGACHVWMRDQVYTFDAYGRDTANYEWLLGHLKEKDFMNKEDIAWPEPDEDILVLSTCYGRAGTTQRMVLLCREVRRAMVPEYYNDIKDVLEYGGDGTPVDPSTVTDYVPEEGVGSMMEMLGD